MVILDFEGGVAKFTRSENRGVAFNRLELLGSVP